MKIPDFSRRNYFFPSCYSALIEFSQSSGLNVFWEMNNIDSKFNKFDFTQFVGSVPASSILVINSPPVVVSSYFQGYKYVAVYASIPDVSARGFSREIILAVSCSDVLNDIEKKCVLLVKRFQEYSNTQFMKNIVPYIVTLRSKLKDLKPEDRYYSQLQSKSIELDVIITHLNIDIPDDVQVYDSTSLQFFMIEDNLKKIEEIINLESYVDEIKNMFYLYKNQASFWNMNEKFPRYVCNSPIIGQILFSVLCGNKVTVFSSSTDYYYFVLLFYFLQDFDINPVKLIESTNKKNIIGRYSDSSIVDFDEFYYQGVICETNSIIWDIAKVFSDDRIASSTSIMRSQLDKYFNAYLLDVNEFIKNNYLYPEGIKQFLLDKGYKYVDFPILYRYTLNNALIKDIAEELKSKSIIGSIYFNP